MCYSANCEMNKLKESGYNNKVMSVQKQTSTVLDT